MNEIEGIDVIEEPKFIHNTSYVTAKASLNKQ